MISTQLEGLFVPLITPMYKGDIDILGLHQLIESIEPYISGYVPCLSSGEGDIITDNQRIEVVNIVKTKTSKPIYPGIKRHTVEEIIKLAKRAEEIGVNGITIAIPSSNIDISYDFMYQISQKTKLPIIIYNTETANISTIQDLEKFNKIPNIIGIKDSSMNDMFFAEMIAAKQEGIITISILQGMENKLQSSKGCDGFLISLANIEPALCKKVLDSYDKEDLEEVQKKRREYNLGGDWYISLKALLYTRGIIKSAEQAKSLHL